MDSVMGKDFLTVKQASERSGYSAEYIRRLIRNEKIAAEKVGTVYFVRVESLDAYTQRMLADANPTTGPRP